MIEKLKPEKNKIVPFIVFSSFLCTYIIARIFIFLFPGLFLNFHGVHVHHFAYGILIITFVGLYDLICRPAGKKLYITSVLFGIGFALSFDEFGMWLRLKDNGVSRYGYDVIIILILLFLNIIYFEGFWRGLGKRIIFGKKDSKRINV
jgi:hypothetical protein